MATTDVDARRNLARCSCAFVLGIALFVGASPARADDTKQRAEALFQQARELMARSDFSRACPLLEESYKLDQGTGTLLAVALCHEGSGKPALALREFREALRASVRTNRPDRVMLAESHVQELEATVPRILVKPPSPEPAGLSIMLDDQPLDRAMMVAGAPVDPGEHTVVATAPNTVAYRTRIAVEASGAAAKPTVVVPALVTATPAPVAVAPSLRTVMLGVGVAGLATAGVFGGLAFDADARSEKECRGTLCSQRGIDLNHEARRDATIANVSAIVGGLAFGAGIYLLFRRGPPLRPRGMASLPSVAW
jgi:hypothetical protein